MLILNNNWDSVPKRAQTLFAAECANKTLPIFEQEHPNDNRPRKAVEAAFKYGLTGKPVSQNIINTAYQNFCVFYAAYYTVTSAADAAIYWSSRATGLNFDKLKEKVIGKTKFDKKWKTTHTLGIAKKIWETRNLGNLPILADALIDAGCDMNLVNYMISNEEQTLTDFFLWNLNL